MTDIANVFVLHILQDLVMLLQHPKTSNWGKAELEIVLSRAHMWRTMFKNSSSHMNHLAV